MENVKMEALTKYLDEEGIELQQGHDENNFINGREEYLVLTDDEADEMAKEYILDSVWAFNYSFLCSHSEAIAAIPQKDYEAMAGKLCESFNKAALAMIDDKDHFVDDAIKADGRGHFLSGYDGEENEVKLNGVYYFIYRTN
jgi:hypothetical protein